MRISVRTLAMLAPIALAIVTLHSPVIAFQTLDEIIAKNLDARGGIEKLRALESVKFTGTVTIQGGAPGTSREPLKMTTWTKRPNLFRRDTVFPDRSHSVAFDGSTVWVLDSTVGTPEQVTGPQAAQTRHEEFDPVFLDYKERGHRIELVGTETIDGVKAHHLRVTRKNGQVEQQYLSADTGLEMRTVTSVEQGPRKIQLRNELSDYRTVDGMQVPFLMRSFVDNQPATQIQLETVEFNLPMAAEMFKLVK
jgi:outer membrane lipoprotein-sorting protein